ncbi:MAG: HAMP domain-containing histidine kinase [Endomicrobium sp.]|jgi:signal transduction histidine kinase|nr:HAMP domain-containing histidine kinase [Endomicrobium sp.]
MKLRIKFILFSSFLSLIFALTITSAVLLGCRTFFARAVQTEAEGFFSTFVNTDENSIEIGKKELNLFYNGSLRSFFWFVLKNILFAFFVCVILGIVGAVLVYKLVVKSFEDLERRFKDDFLVSVSHEFKSPLSAIEGYTDLLLEKSNKNSFQDITEGLNIIKNSTERLKYFINNVLCLVDIRAGKVKSNGDFCYIDEIIEEEICKFKSVASLEKKKIIIDIGEALPPVAASKSMVSLSVSGILSNAFKFTKQEDTVAIKAMLSRSHGNNFVEVWISDTGVGISKELLKKIFEKFYQIKKSKFEKLSGSGLGLSLASEIVSLYRGNIWAESKVGEGTTIKFTLPVFKKI